MTPQEKAEELVYKMYDKMFYYRDGYNSSDVIGAAKQCALIAVDEIIKTFDCTTPQSIEYWEQVKHELTKQQEQ
jgi:hypothetical protein